MTKKVVFKITGMHCTSCVMNIDGELEDANGVKNAFTSYSKQISEIEFNSEEIDEEKIIEIIDRLGYSAKIAS